MALDIPAIQKTLAVDQRGRLAALRLPRIESDRGRSWPGLTGAHTTRRWYYFIPASGHAEEARARDRAVRARQRAGRQDVVRRAAAARAGRRRDPARIEGRRDGVLAGVRDPVPLARGRRHGGFHPARSACAIVSSGDLVQRFEAAWDDGGDRDAPGGVREALPDQGPDVRVRGREALGRRDAHRVRGPAADGASGSAKRGSIADSAPIVGGAGERRQSPLRAVSRQVSRPIRPNELLLLDLWGKLDQPGAVYADITWTGFAGHAARPSRQGLRAAIVPGRDAAVAKVKSAVAAGQPVHGWEVDRATRDVITAAGLRRPVHPPDRPQPGRRGARQRRAHGRLRDARRPAARARHRVHDRAGHLHHGIRGSDGNQHGGRPEVGRGHRPLSGDAGQDCDAVKLIPGQRSSYR